MNETA